MLIRVKCNGVFNRNQLTVEDKVISVSRANLGNLEANKVVSHYGFFVVRSFSKTNFDHRCDRVNPVWTGFNSFAHPHFELFNDKKYMPFTSDGFNRSEQNY